MRITMAMVAKAAGVNQATVSRALRGLAGEVSAERRQHILKVAEKLGYRSDPLVSALMAQRKGRGGVNAGAGTLAVVAFWPEERETFFTLPYFRGYWRGVQARAAQSGYAVDTFWCNGKAEPVRVLERTLRARGIQGVVVGHSHEQFKKLPIDVEGLAVSLLGTGIRTPGLSHVQHDTSRQFHLAWERARADGGKRIGLVTWRLLSLKNQGGWVGPCLYAQQELPKAQRVPVLELAVREVAAVLPWLERYQLDALISEDAGLLMQVGEVRPGVRLYALEVYEPGPVAGVDVRQAEIGGAAVDLVTAQLNRGERGVPKVAKRVLVEGEWMPAAQ